MADNHNLTSYGHVRRFVRIVKLILSLVLLVLKALTSLKDFLK
jgi:hypothetical protein